MTADQDHGFKDAALEMVTRIMVLIQANNEHQRQTIEAEIAERGSIHPDRAKELRERSLGLAAAGNALNLAMSSYGKLVL